jgi:hypothetical protein
MTPRIAICMLAMICIVSSYAQQKSNLLNPTPVKASSLQLKSDSWYDRARQFIAKEEYGIKWKNNLGEYVAVNRKNQIGFYFQPNGYRVVSFSTNEATNWEVVFVLNAIQRGNTHFKTTFGSIIKQRENELVYQYPNYKIEYLNDTNGMRQNFIINERIKGNGKLEVVLHLDGDLNAAPTDGSGVSLYATENGKAVTKMKYDQLKVWDRDLKPLTASIEVRDNGKTLVIAVEDGAATYPVTIDPLNHTADWTDNGLGVLPSLDVLYGSTVSDAGDVNNDGFDDIIIGAPASINVLSSSVIASTGQAFIYFGSGSGLSATPSVTLESSSTINALFGFSVSSAGDINADGFDDVIVGAPGDEATLNFGIPFGSLTNKIGKAYVYYGNSSAAFIQGSVLAISLRATDFLGATFGLTVNPLYGYSVSGAGDVNNDGYSDVIVGSPTYTDLGTLALAGRATVYLGSASGLNTASPVHRNGDLLANTLFGFSVSSAGDMNNDGADEVLIGAPGALTLLPGLTGSAYVYTGIALPTTGSISAAPIKYSSSAVLKTLFGFSVSNAGDVNDDGFDDIVVGEPATLSLSGLVTVGRASVFFGGASLSDKTSADVTLRSPRDPDILSLVDGNLLFGFSVSGGKDIDCDGIDDIVVGEPGGTSLTGLTGINAAGGQTYIYYGKDITGPASNPGWELKETGSLVVANLLGYSVSTAGDVNGDGENDILIGAANGTLDLSNLLTGVLNFVFVQSVGSAYVYQGCVIPTLFTLPVTLAQFNGYLQNNTVLLKWKTSTEENASHFEIERSVNGAPFQKIGTVNAKGDGSITADYSFIDNGPQPVSNVYRLKVVDKDGTFFYSTLVNIKLEKTSYIKVRSTFVSTEIAIEFNNVSKGDYLVEMIGMDGRLLQQARVNISSDYTVKSINTTNAHAKGIYIIKVQKQGGKEIVQQKIMIN